MRVGNTYGKSGAIQSIPITVEKRNRGRGASHILMPFVSGRKIVNGVLYHP